MLKQLVPCFPYLPSKVEEKGVRVFELLKTVNEKDSVALGQILGLFYFKMAFVHSLFYSCLDLIFPSKEKRNPRFPSKEGKPYLANLHSDFLLSTYMALRPQWSNLGVFFPQFPKF